MDKKQWTLLIKSVIDSYKSDTRQAADIIVDVLEEAGFIFYNEEQGGSSQ